MGVRMSSGAMLSIGSAMRMPMFSPASYRAEGSRIADPPDRREFWRGGFDRRRQCPGQQVPDLRFRRPDRAICRHAERRHRRSGEGWPGGGGMGGMGGMDYSQLKHEDRLTFESGPDRR